MLITADELKRRLERYRQQRTHYSVSFIQQVYEMARHLLRSEPMARVQIPFSLFLSALEEFNREELVLLRQRVEERLAA